MRFQRDKVAFERANVCCALRLAIKGFEALKRSLMFFVPTPPSLSSVWARTWWSRLPIGFAHFNWLKRLF